MYAQIQKLMCTFLNSVANLLFPIQSAKIYKYFFKEYHPQTYVFLLPQRVAKSAERGFTRCNWKYFSLLTLPRIRQSKDSHKKDFPLLSRIRPSEKEEARRLYYILLRRKRVATFSPCFLVSYTPVLLLLSKVLW